MIAARHNMVSGSGILNAQRAWHAQGWANTCWASMLKMSQL
jgi:hypothetical protein